jgi:hypothetical protein
LIICLRDMRPSSYSSTISPARYRLSRQESFKTAPSIASVRTRPKLSYHAKLTAGCTVLDPQTHLCCMGLTEHGCAKIDEPVKGRVQLRRNLPSSLCGGRTPPLTVLCANRDNGAPSLSLSASVFAGINQSASQLALRARGRRRPPPSRLRRPVELHRRYQDRQEYL